MAKGVSFESLLQALNNSWLRAREAKPAQHQTVIVTPSTPTSDHHIESSSAGIGESETVSQHTPLHYHPTQMRPAMLTLSFECELRQRWDRRWQLHIVHTNSKSWFGNRPRHRVEIVLDGDNSGRGKVLFDGCLWRQFGNSDKLA